MADDFFKVRNGFIVGEDKFTVDGTTGDVEVTGDLDVTGGITFTGDLAVNGGDITTTNTTATVFNTTATTVNIGGAGTTVSIGANTGTTTVNNDLVADSLTVSGDLAVNGADITTTSVGTATVFNTNATTVNIGGAATTMSIGAGTGTTTINNDLVADSLTVSGDLAVNGADITTTSVGTATVFNTNATTVNIGGAATTMSIGNASGTVTIPGNLTVDGTTTTINTQDLLVEDKNITIGNVAVPTDVTAAGGGITLLGATNKTITWNNSTDGWELNQPLKVTGDAVLTGDLTVTGNDIKSSSATAITLSGANVAVVGTLDVQGGTITESTGALSITTGASNGSITLDPNGTGNVVMTFANGGNLTNDRNYVAGSVRDATTLAAGDAWSFLSGAANFVRGISIDNTGDTTKRPGVILRANSNNRPMLVAELNRGTVASPLAVANGGTMLEIAASGWNGTQFVTDAIAVAPISLSFTAAEAFTSPSGVNTANGSRLRVDAQPPGVTATAVSRSNIINHTATAATYRADAWTFATREVAAGGAALTQMTLDVSGNAVHTGDVAVNGGDLTTTQTTATLFNNNATTLNVGGAATAISMGATSGTATVRNALNVRSGLAYDMFTTTAAAGGSGENNIVITKSDSSSANALAIINFITQRSTAGTYSPTLNGDILGQFKFNGNVSSTTTPSFGGGPAGGVLVSATENWAVGAIGSKIVFQATKNGTTAPADVISISPNSGTIKTDTLTIEDSAGTDYMVLNNSKILNNRPHRNVITTATTTEGSTYSPAATDNNSISLTINTGSGTTVIDLANLTGQGDGGMYTIMVFNNAATGTPIQVKNTRINTGNLTTHTIPTGDRIMITAYIVGDYATAEHLVVA